MTKKENESVDCKKTVPEPVSGSDAPAASPVDPNKAATQGGADYYEQLLRLRADFENYRKRVEREKAAQRAWAKEEILVKQISLLDIMTQALTAAKNTRDIEGVLVGLEMIIKEFEKMLAEEGVTAVAADGSFNPAVHEAVETLEDASLPDGGIKEVMSKGYMMGERLIRPARVKIVKNKIQDKEIPLNPPFAKGEKDESVL